MLELQEAWDSGFSVKSSQQALVAVRLALSCVACDIPASRKVCGFLGHTATLGCNKCLKNSVPVLGRPLTSQENWPLRSSQSHRQLVQKY